MKRFANGLKTVTGLVLMAAFALVLAAPGCSQKAGTPPEVTPPPAAEAAHAYPTQAQAKLPTIRLWLGPAEVSAEMALTPIQQETGMMFRTNLDENSGMLFPLPYPQQASFWMLHCPLPLTAAYIDPQGQILEIHDLHVNDTNSVVADAPNVYYVLEMNDGWFARHHIEPGTVVRTERGTLQETFTRNTR